MSNDFGPETDTDLVVGMAAMAMVVPVGSHGAYRESIVLSADSVVRAPQGFSYPEVATLPMNGLTARLSLDQLALRSGQPLAVTGAAGAYGGYVIQIAKHEGLRVIADASPDGFVPVAAVHLLPATVRAYPAIADGHLFVRNDDTLLAGDLTR